MTRTAVPRSGPLSDQEMQGGFFNSVTGTLRRADAWLDARGKWAWIAAMVAGFVIFVPLGLAMLAWMIWGKQMFGFTCCNRENGGRERRRHGRFGSSGNSAFDAYRSETLRRLEEEQGAFESFLHRLREARDKQEFDRFMEERARAVTDPEPDAAKPAGEVSEDEARRGTY